MSAAGAGAVRDRSARTGGVAALALACVGIGLALASETAKPAVGFYSDEATYYLMGHSLVADGDLAYRREDLERVWREFPKGPQGVFLKRGRDVTGVGLTAQPPFVVVHGVPDPDPLRLFYGKSFIYPLVASPFVWLFGTKGFVIFNGLLLGAAAFMAFVFLAARSTTGAALLVASAFVGSTVLPAYVVWIMPEVFNFTLGVAACFLWLHKLAAPAESTPVWLGRPGTDLAAAGVVGLAAFSKITNAVLLAPIVAWLVWQRRWRQAALAAVVCGLVTIALFAANVAITGEWNYQGGERGTFYNEFPFQSADKGFEIGAERGRDVSLLNVIFEPGMFWTNLTANMKYFLVGRYAGLVAYFFPGVFAAVAFLAARGRRASWQWLVLGAVVLHGFAQIITQPYTYLGSGGSLGNRYFIGAYGACLFLLPPMRSIAAAVVPWVGGLAFVWQILLHPFYVSSHPSAPAKRGLQRLLPVELTNVNDLPIMTEGPLIRHWYGDTGAGDPGFLAYYLDDNAYLPEADRKSFWIRGEARAEMLVNPVQPMRWIELALSAGPVPTTVTVKVSGRTQTVSIEEGGTRVVRLGLGPGFPYKGNREAPTPVWVLSIEAGAGFYPKTHDPLSKDDRYLGVRVKPIVIP